MLKPYKQRKTNENLENQWTTMKAKKMYENLRKTYESQKLEIKGHKKGDRDIPRLVQNAVQYGLYMKMC